MVTTSDQVPQGSISNKTTAKVYDFSEGTNQGWSQMEFDASLSNSEYGSSSTVMPASADMPVGIYLGRPAEV